MKGRQIGPWTLEQRLGGGGNGVVWQARHLDGSEGALKLLRSSGRERRARFRAEIDFLLHHDPGPGVLPILDFSLPDSTAEDAWYVMPVARLLLEALDEEAGVAERVGALEHIARTLARLAERGVGHRDIKPDNLFERDGQYLVGDFGLVTYPEKDPVTKAGRRLGPTDYLAPEMRANADKAEPEPADVYSLAKTLWVVLTGNAPPLPGPHRIEDEAYRLGTYVSHPRLGELDLLLERCTQHVPSARPRLAEVADELAAWRLPATSTEVPTLHDIAKQISGLSEPGVRDQAAQQRRRELFNTAWDEAQASLAPIRDRLEGVFPHVNWHGNPAPMTDFGHAATMIQEQRTYAIHASNADREPVELYVAIGAQWVEADSIRWAAWLRVEDPYVGPRTVWTSNDGAPLGSARQRTVITHLANELGARLRDAAFFALGRMELRADAERYAEWTGEESDAGAISAPWSAFSPFAEGDFGCYVVDSGNNRIARFGPGGRPLPWQSSGGPGRGYENLDFPAGGCFDHDRYIWIADHDNRRLRRFDEHGGPVEGFGLEPPGVDILWGPSDVASGPDGSVYVTDRLRNCVVKFSPQGRRVAEWGDGGRGPGELTTPCGIAVRHGEFVYVSDSGNDRIQKFRSDGRLVNAWGSPGSAEGSFRAPHGIALDDDENVYVADSENHRIQVFTSNGDFVRRWGANGGSGVPGSMPGQFIQPRGVSVDGAGNVYVAEFGGGRVQRFGPAYIERL
jgi:serine/threonine protein kinase/sugar lactone lactonase YvrE